MIYIDAYYNFDNFEQSKALDMAFDVQAGGNQGEVVRSGNLLNVSHDGNKYIFKISKGASDGEFEREANAILDAIGVVGRYSNISNY